MKRKMVETSQWLFPSSEKANKKTQGSRKSSLVEHITNTFNASTAFIASLVIAFFICYISISTMIILSILKGLINHLLCCKWSPFPLSKLATVSSSPTILNRYSSRQEGKILSSSPSPELIVELSPPKPKNIVLPESSNKTLFVGLRRIIVRFTFNPPHDKFDFVVYPLIKGKRRPCYVLKRPGLDEFICKAQSTSFEVVIYTRWIREYASPIIDMLDSTGELITHRLYQNACTNQHGKGVFVKDLVTTGRKLDRSVIVDNHPRKHVKQWTNVIVVRPFLGEHMDTELINLLKFFEVEGNFSDLRELINITSFSQDISILPLPSTDKKTLFLDLDHTLTYASAMQPSDNNYLVNHSYFIVKRRGVEELLHAAHWASFEIVIFTAASAGYASPIVDWLDPDNRYIKHRLYRDACTPISGGYYEKNLTTTGRRLEWLIIIDNNPKFVQPRENALIVKPFRGDSSDIELLNLLFFDAQSRFNDIRVAAKYVNSLFHSSGSYGRRKNVDGIR